MQLAAGVRLVDSDGKPIDSLVPIIVDPHEDNAALQEATGLLDNYRTLHNSIYPSGVEDKDRGFFATKIETLKDISEVNTTADKFYFKMQRVSDSTFDDFIGLSEMDPENRLFAQLLFSKDELKTHMREGFYGSPNIGCVALNEFKKSKDFEAFRSAYKEGDKLFFIGSIFGGTGAAGLPLFISSIRDLQHRDNTDMQGKDAAGDAPIGALIVMPYFSIASEEKSPINDSEFTIKTRSALRYYQTNLNRYINDIYYIADPNGTEDFVNDPGSEGNQRENKAHIVEYIGALALVDFVASNNTETVEDAEGRKKARTTKYRAYGLQEDMKEISFKGLSRSSNRVFIEPMMKFYLLRHFMEDHLRDLLKKPFAIKYKPEIEENVISRELESFFRDFDTWIAEMSGHGSNAHNLSLFLPVRDNYTEAFSGVPTKKGLLFGSKTVKANDVQKCLDSVAQNPDNIKNMPSGTTRWFTIADKALQQIISENYDYTNLK